MICVILVLVAFAAGVIITTLDRNYCELRAEKLAKWRPVNTSKWVIQGTVFTAPINIKYDDVLQVIVSENGLHVLNRIARNGKTIWKREGVK